MPPPPPPGETIGHVGTYSYGSVGRLDDDNFIWKCRCGRPQALPVSPIVPIC
ncbi:MAG: hypothetical protein WKF58_07000 [Ilumatobacteraceae bacterium]